ncbi:hypothetical protein P0D88_34865 [Paraburkholderia sp. RL18-103-BIB-C]|uniref:hypothetical protein n=1 Tax=Paraburkholderia sp. RL18-103-BIB-C TaxID=3031637 RepID=UPI0038BD5B64
MKTQPSGDQEITQVCRRKTDQLVADGYRVSGLLVRRGGRLAIVTNLGRVEYYGANEHGGIGSRPYDDIEISL